MKKKKLKKRLKRLSRSYVEKIQVNHQLLSDLKVLVYDPNSYKGESIKAGVRLEDDIDKQIWADRPTTKGIWRHCDCGCDCNTDKKTDDT